MPSLVSLVACGSNSAGQLGTNDVEDHHTFQQCYFLDHLLPSTTISITRILDIACGANHSVILLERSIENSTTTTELWATGDGLKGQLGNTELLRQHAAGSSRVFRPVDFGQDPQIKEAIETWKMKPKLVAAAWETTYVVFEGEHRDDLLVSMGSDDWGSLGAPKLMQPNASENTRIIDLSKWTPKMGLLKISALRSGPHHVVVQVAGNANDGHQTQSELVLGWGRCRHGQLGPEYQPGPSTSSSKAQLHPYLNRPHIISSLMSTSPLLALGAQHSISAASDSKALQALGCNKKGQQNVLRSLKEQASPIIAALDCTWNGTYVLSQDRTLFSGGSWERGQLGRGHAMQGTPGPVAFPGNSKPFSIACGTEHVLAICRDILSSDTVYGWGWNEHGNLGLGSGKTADVWEPVCIWPPDDTTMKIQAAQRTQVTGIWAGSATSWISLELEIDSQHSK
ncbi:regulator of chromosome condensation 1/beta-lactamase-inhibitor protein II [Flagelloscypha sp. PMI_526]|nr:regulator of chromosome condensation 1/beta-lactamase-inhibitor protein II [Flagelloscypha sp. PMI_526]